MGNSIKIFRNTDELSLYFAQLLVRKVNNTADGQMFTLALSGGSTPQKVFAYLASEFKTKIDWAKILIFWSDERCVNPGNIESNYRMAKENLLMQVPIPEKNIFRIWGEAEPFSESERYSRTIIQQVHSSQNTPQFDLIMLGIGDDGHTASIFPGNLGLFHTEKLCSVAEHPVTKQKRITITGKVINQAKTIVILATGKSKAEIVMRIIERKNACEELPASLLHPLNGDLLWLLDEGASSKLGTNLLSISDV